MDRLIIKVEGGPTPRYSTTGSSGADLFANVGKNIILKPGNWTLIPTGIKVEIPEGYEGQIRPRSGLAFEKGIGILNAPGTIDSDYRGEIKVIIYNFGKEDFIIHPGDRIAQLIITSVVHADFVPAKLESSARGEGGFGHTGKKLKICLVSDYYYPYVGGVSEHVHYLYLGLKKRGHDVRILTSSFGDNKPYVSEDIYRVGRGLVFPKNRSFSSITVGLGISAKVKKYLAKENFDIVHLHGPLAPMLPFLGLKHSEAYNFITFHSAHEDSIGYTLFEPVLERYFRKLNGMIAVSEAARDSIGKYFPGEYKIIPNGVDTDRFHPDVDPLSEMVDKKPIILFVGRLEPRKGFKYILRAFSKVVAKTDANLVVVGKGALTPYYRKFVDENLKDRVIFTGYVEPELLPRYYTSCDIFCTPAFCGESFGIVILEAMASAKPVLASNIEGFRNVVEDGKQGILFKPKDTVDLADKLMLLLNDKKLREKLGKAGRKRSEIFSWDRVVAQIESFYLERIPVGKDQIGSKG